MMTKMPGWQTWIIHAAIAAGVVLLWSRVVPVPAAALLGFWGYAFREMDQLWRKWRKGATFNWLDMAMDVIAPALSSTAVYLWLIHLA